MALPTNVLPRRSRFENSRYTTPPMLVARLPVATPPENVTFESDSDSAPPMGALLPVNVDLSMVVLATEEFRSVIESLYRPLYRPSGLLKLELVIVLILPLQ